jgi:ferredoxin
VKVAIDDTRCEGHGRCYAIAPVLFEPDEIGHGHVLGDGTAAPEDGELARRAVANCPEQAISLSEEHLDG